MKLSIISMLFFSIFLSCNASIAGGLDCHGKDSSDQKINLTLDVSGKIIVNGHVLQIEETIDDGKSIRTNNFVSDLGILSLIMLTHVQRGSDDLILQQVNVATKAVIAEALLLCKRYQ